MEFLGAVLIGASVTNTIRSKIIDKDFYEDVPELLMFGMLSALIVASLWLLLATYLEFPVSTTHDIIGCIIGFSLASMGWDVRTVGNENRRIDETNGREPHFDTFLLTERFSFSKLSPLYSPSIGRPSKS